MNTHLISKIEQPHLSKGLPNFKVGDTIEVNTIIREGEKQRIQLFKGLVISISGSGTRKMFTVRKISYGIGVEKSFPLNSNNIKDITVIKHGGVRRSKLYYLRERVGKLALKVKPGQPAPVIENASEAQDVLEAEGKVELAEVKSDEEMAAEAKEKESKQEIEDVKIEGVVEEAEVVESNNSSPEEASEEKSPEEESKE